MTKIKIGIIGFGTVGSGVFKVLNENKQEILAKTGKTFEVVSVLDLDKEKIESITNNPELIADSFDDLLSKSDIVLELIGGTTIAYEFVKKVIQASKPIVTANKALIALHGKELFTLAELNNTVILYEAAVAGGIPLIKAVREGLASNKIEWVAGILTGITDCLLILRSNKHKN